MRRAVSFATLVIVAALAWPASAPADPAAVDRVGDLAVSSAWAAPTSLSRRAGSVYLTIANTGPRDDQLIAAHTPAAEESELRSHRIGEVVGRARRVASVKLPAGKTIVLRPGGEHIALIDVKTPQRMGDRLDVLLMFEKAGLLTISVPVAAGPPATSP
ncbi:MAG: copper chaperone PCu(A)C [Alphaproteobacteria bacterium]|nr:copper chaperone PCu(A)C [Alphaproteobacteria bacterium]